jgi:hydrogenase maturation protein HypF
LLFELYGHEALERYAAALKFSPRELSTIRTMLHRGLNSPLCSSIGRLFDGVAALIGLRQLSEFEGQAAMDLEFLAEEIETREAYPLRISDAKSPTILDWRPLLEAILWDREHSATAGEISARFHNALVEGIVAIAHRAGQSAVALSGGCFQNRYLLERTITRLRDEGFRPFWHRHVPPNDGGIALGQIVAARRNHD